MACSGALIPASSGGSIQVALRIRKGDLVQVISGADRGKQGRVIGVNRARGLLRVEKVRILNMPGKFRRRFGRPARTAGWKKAMVSLREGDRIEIV